MREIGSMLELNPDRLLADVEHMSFTLPFEQKASVRARVFFNTGRSAIEAFLRAYGTQKNVFLPSFLCTSVTDAVKRAGNPVSCYPVRENLQPDADALRSLPVCEGDIVYCMQYFGVRIADDVLDAFTFLRQKGALLFEDLTMSLLSEASSSFAFGDVLIASLRKWFAVPDGGVLCFRKDAPVTKDCLKRLSASYADVTASNDYTAYYFAAQISKFRYLQDPSTGKKESYLALMHHANDVLFSDYTIRPVSEITRRLLPTFDIDALRERRYFNYAFLYRALLEDMPLTLFPLCERDFVPFGLIVLSERRDALLADLIANDIYANVHWRPSAETNAFASSRALSEQCLTLPVDARYNETDMERIAETVRTFFQKERRITHG